MAKGAHYRSTSKKIFGSIEHHLGGGMLDLIIHFNKATDKKSAAKFLEDHGLIATEAFLKNLKKY